MKKSYLLSLLLLSPFLAHADALKALGEAQAFIALLILGLISLVVIGFLFVIYKWPQGAGVPYVVGVPLFIITWVRLAADYPGVGLNMLLLLALLLNGLVWVRRFRPMPVRIAGVLALLVGSIGLVSTILLNN
jgi:hypothetical protein